MDCDRAREVIFLVADEELQPELNSDFEEHLSRCLSCSRRALFTRRLLAVVRERCSRREAPEHLRVKILQAFAHRRVIS